MRNPEMTWAVWHYDFNANKIDTYDVFHHCSFSKDVNELKKRKLPLEEFSEELRRAAMYYFWAKCEYEVLVYPWPPIKEDIGRKIDVYQQLRLNWDIFVSYVYYA